MIIQLFWMFFQAVGRFRSAHGFFLSFIGFFEIPQKTEEKERAASSEGGQVRKVIPFCGFCALGGSNLSTERGTHFRFSCEVANRDQRSPRTRETIAVASLASRVIVLQSLASIAVGGARMEPPTQAIKGERR